jgi:hypothetical protein
MRGRIRTKKSWIYNGDNGPEVYELDEHGRLKDDTNGRRTRRSDVPRPTPPPLFSMDARMQTLPHISDTSSSVLSSTGDLDTTRAPNGSNHTQSVQLTTVSEWFPESTLNAPSSTTESQLEFEPETSGFFFGSDPDFQFW